MFVLLSFVVKSRRKDVIGFASSDFFFLFARLKSGASMIEKFGIANGRV